MPTSPSTLTEAEARTRAELVGGVSYSIELDLTEEGPCFGFAARVDFAAAQPGTRTFLELEVAEVRTMLWNGETLDPSAYDGHRVALPALQERNSLTIEGRAAYDLTGLGMHRSVDPVDGSAYIYSDLQPYEAHRSFPCFDQPDIKGSIRLRVRVPEEWLVVSAELAQPEEVDPGDGCRWWGFPPTMPLAPYVLGLAAGPFHKVERQHGAIPLGLYCARSLAAYLDAEELFQVTANGLDYFERVFQIPYPFAKYDQVFCPEKVDSAMESPGCVTITDQYLWRGQPTVRQRSVRADVILHEMAHMWFGDLVTMRWWDDLWLNESFATLMAVFAVDAATDFDDAWVGFATFNKQVGSRVDQLGTSHPVVTPVADVEAVRGNFDRITYEKGAAALRQLVAFVGEENFFAALHLYLTQHKEANAVFADLVDALQVTSGRDVQSWARAWLETVGINTLACEVESPEPGAPMSRATVVQSARPGQPTLRPHQIRVGLFDWVGDELGRVGSVELGIEGPRTEVAELIGVRRPPLLLPNDGDLSYAKIRLDPLSLATVQRHLGAVREPLARALIWDSLWDMTRDLELPAHRFAETVAEHLAGESDTTLVGVVLGNFRSATRRYGDPERGRELESAMAEAGWQVLASSPPGSDRQSVWLRGFISLATSPDQIERCQGILAGRDLPLGIALDAELRWLLVFALAARGAVGEREIKAALVADPSSSGMVRAAAARASRPTASAKRAAWARLAAATATVEEVRAISIRMGGVGREDLLLPYVPRLPRLFDTSLAKRGGEFAVELGDWLPLSLAPSPELATICRKNLERTDLDPLVRRIFANLLEDTERLLRARAFDQSELRAE